MKSSDRDSKQSNNKIKQAKGTVSKMLTVPWVLFVFVFVVYRKCGKQHQIMSYHTRPGADKSHRQQFDAYKAAHYSYAPHTDDIENKGGFGVADALEHTFNNK